MSLNKEKLEKTLNLKIKDVALYETAFTHRSYLNEHPGYKLPSNERLEFLGDAVLQLVSSQHLFNTYNQPEGILTNYRSAIVNTKSLAKESKRLGFGEFLFLSRGEDASGGREREYILANTFEAVLGAIYLDNSLEEAIDFVTRELLYKVEKIVKTKAYKDSKSTFQEIAQDKFSITPTYKVLESWGADHDRTFKVGVYLNDKQAGVGEGSSKQRAQQNAAAEALDNLGAV